MKQFIIMICAVVTLLSNPTVLYSKPSKTVKHTKKQQLKKKQLKKKNSPAKKKQAPRKGIALVSTSVTTTLAPATTVTNTEQTADDKKPLAATTNQTSQSGLTLSVNDELNDLDIPPAPSARKIRVLLESHETKAEPKFVIHSKHGFILESPIASGVTALYQAQEIHLMLRNKKLYFRCKDGNYRGIKNSSIEICNPHRKITLGSKTFQGSLQLVIDHDEDKLYIINKLPLEDYIFSVVQAEGLNSWPLDMHKLQAIISRTYAVYLMQRARERSPQFKYFDIKCTNFHQRYEGLHKHTRLRQAVDETQDLILTHNDAVALTMFDISCGGIIPGLITPVDKRKPYLNRVQRCTFCTSCPSYLWKETFNADTVVCKLKELGSLKDKMASFGTLAEIKMRHIDKAGVVHKILITDTRGHSVVITGNQLRSTNSHKIKSLAFSIEFKNNKLTITGFGYGHLKGVCQFGCVELLKRGWSIKDVLSFYYPGTKISRLVH